MCFRQPARTHKYCPKTKAQTQSRKTKKYSLCSQHSTSNYHILAGQAKTRSFMHPFSPKTGWIYLCMKINSLVMSGCGDGWDTLQNPLGYFKNSYAQTLHTNNT